MNLNATSLLCWIKNWKRYLGSISVSEHSPPLSCEWMKIGKLLTFRFHLSVEKEQEAMDKFDALKMQLELIRQYRRQLLAVKQSEDEPIEQRLNPMHWFHSRKPLNSTAPTSDSTPSILLDGDHHMSYRVRT